MKKFLLAIAFSPLIIYASVPTDGSPNPERPEQNRTRGRGAYSSKYELSEDAQRGYDNGLSTSSSRSASSTINIGQSSTLTMVRLSGQRRSCSDTSISNDKNATILAMKQPDNTAYSQNQNKSVSMEQFFGCDGGGPAKRGNRGESPASAQEKANQMSLFSSVIRQSKLEVLRAELQDAQVRHANCRKLLGIDFTQQGISFDANPRFQQLEQLADEVRQKQHSLYNFERQVTAQCVCMMTPENKNSMQCLANNQSKRRFQDPFGIWS